MPGYFSCYVVSCYSWNNRNFKNSLNAELSLRLSSWKRGNREIRAEKAQTFQRAWSQQGNMSCTSSNPNVSNGLRKLFSPYWFSHNARYSVHWAELIDEIGPDGWVVAKWNMNHACITSLSYFHEFSQFSADLKFWQILKNFVKLE